MLAHRPQLYNAQTRTGVCPPALRRVVGDRRRLAGGSDSGPRTARE